MKGPSLEPDILGLPMESSARAGKVTELEDGDELWGTAYWGSHWAWGTGGQPAYPGQALHVLLAAKMGFALVVSKYVQAKQNTPASQL